MNPRKINYDTYISKHCARYYGWLPASKEHRQRSKTKPLKYFTLCATEAIDVFMLEKEGVLPRDSNGNLPNVIICESELGDAAEIRVLVRPPVGEAILVGRLEELITYQDDAQDKKLLAKLETIQPSKEQRERLDRREKSLRLKGEFPFDIINFDTCGNLLNPDDDTNKLLYESFEMIFDLQKPTHSFLLLVTTPITHIHANLQTRFKRDFESNVSGYPQIQEALQSAIGTVSYDKIAYNKRIALGFAKSVVTPAARKHGWCGEHKGIYIYENIKQRRILSSVIRFSKSSGASDESVYVEDIIRVIHQMPQYYSYKNSLKNREVKEHLREVKEYREKIRDQYRQKP